MTLDYMGSDIENRDFKGSASAHKAKRNLQLAANSHEVS